jgi:hypothetical protein
MNKIVNGQLVEMTPEEVASWEAEQAAYEPPPAPPYKVYKSVFIQRLGPPEAALLEAALQAEDPKLRLMYNAVEYFMSDDPLTAYLHWVVSVALGSEAEPNTTRADELLAPMEAA